jgi:hypothetical protein
MRSERGSFEAPYLSDAPDLAVVFGRGGGLVGQMRRRLAGLRLRGSLRRVSQNRLETYDDEARLLEAAAGLLRERGREDLAAVVARGEDLARTREQERALYEAAARAPAPPRAGMREVLVSGQ